MNTDHTKWNQLLGLAVAEPGVMLKAYSAFHGYSLGNQILALVQCYERGIVPGPINTYAGWLQLGRQVKKGEKALTLCMPLARKRENDAGEKQVFIAAFVYKPRWFVLAQTDGEPIELPTMPGWNRVHALAALNITETPFTDTNGNVQGYARKREVAISPVAAQPHKTLFHELAHVELGHTAELEFSDSEQTPRNLREVEAEAVALLCLDALSLPGGEFCRGYVQHWLRGDTIPEASAQKIFGAADRILKAGRVQ
jgi:antirestriction protein ArdC